MKKMSRKRFIKLAMGMYLMDHRSAALAADTVRETSTDYANGFLLLGLFLLKEGVCVGQEVVKIWDDEKPVKKGWKRAGIGGGGDGKRMSPRLCIVDENPMGGDGDG